LREAARRPVGARYEARVARIRRAVGVLRGSCCYGISSLSRDSALTQNATLLGQKAAALATQLGVGIEIDYENSSSPNLTGMQSFINGYRGVHPYDATGANPAARLTIDLAAGDRYLIALTHVPVPMPALRQS
jgi:hypothetical protein